MESIRILIVDDTPQVRQGLLAVLRLAARKTSSRIEICGEAKDGCEAVRLAHGLHPDAVLMDLEMPVMDGFEATRRIKADLPAVRVVVLSIHDSPEERLRAAEAGADGFIAKGARHETLLDAILAAKPISKGVHE